MSQKVEVTSRGLYLKVLIDELPHLCLALEELLGFQSYKKTTNWYGIEYYMTSGHVVCEYDNQELWSTILTQLNKTLK